MKILRAVSWALLMGLLPVSGAWAKNLAGFVIVSVGDVTAMDTEKGQQRKLERRSKIFAGDEIRTGENAKVQLKFKDKGVIALEENTALEITDYEFSGIEGQPERSFFKLVKGGFRAISGVIGKQNPDDYRMDTPLATIGIRGTDYRAKLTSQLQVSVLSGAVQVRNDGGVITIGDGQDFRYAVVKEPGLRPLGLLEIKQEGSTDGATDKGSSSQGEQDADQTQGEDQTENTPENGSAGARDDAEKPDEELSVEDTRSDTNASQAGNEPESEANDDGQEISITEQDAIKTLTVAPPEQGESTHNPSKLPTSSEETREQTEDDQNKSDSPEAASVDSGTDDVDTTGQGAKEPDATDPGITDPDATDPGITDPGTTDPGTTDPGTTDPVITDPGIKDPGTTDPGTTDSGTTDPRISDTELTEISNRWGIATADKAPEPVTEQSFSVGGLARDGASILPGLFVDKGLRPDDANYDAASIVNVLRQGTHDSDQSAFARYDASVDTTVSGFSWGHWSGGTAELYTDPNDATSFTAVNDDFYWFTGIPADMATIPSSGQARFDRVFVLAGNGSSGPVIEEDAASINIAFTLDWLSNTIVDGDIRIVNGVDGTPAQQSHWSFTNLTGTLQNDSGSPSPILDFGSVSGEVCIAQCSIPAPAIGDLQAFLLGGNQQIAGHFLFWEEGNTAEWVGGVFAVGEDQRYTNTEAQDLNHAFFGVYQENPFEASLVTTSALMRGKSQTPTAGDFLMIDTLEQPYGAVIRLGSGLVESTNPGGSASLHGHMVDWGAWNGSTIATDFAGVTTFATEKYTWISFVPVEASIMDNLSSQVSFSLPYAFYGWQYDGVAGGDVPLQLERGYINVDLAGDTLDGAFVFYGTGRFDVMFSGTTFGDGITVQDSLALFNGSAVNISMDGQYIGSSFADGIAGGFKIGDPGNLDVYATGVYAFGRDERINSSLISTFTQVAYLSVDESDSAGSKVYSGLATFPTSGDFIFRDDVAEGSRVIKPITSSILPNTDLLGSAQVDWGVWDDPNGTATAEIQDDPLDPNSVDTTSSAIAWVVGTPSDLADIPTTGISTYSTIVGFAGYQNALPLSTPGNMSMDVNFASKTFTANMVVNASTDTWNMDYSGSLSGNRLVGDGTGTWNSSKALGVIQGALVGTGSTTPTGAGPEGIMGTFKNHVIADPTIHSSGAFVLQQ